MKEPTTPYSVDVQSKVKINRKFLESKGWKLKKEYPLLETFEHVNDNLLECSIGLYGDFSITELHWMNKTPEKIFATMNPDLTEDDYDTIIKLLNIRVL